MSTPPLRSLRCILRNFLRQSSPVQANGGEPCSLSDHQRIQLKYSYKGLWRAHIGRRAPVGRQALRMAMTQNVRFGVALGGRLGDQVAEHIGGSVSVLLRPPPSLSVISKSACLWPTSGRFRVTGPLEASACRCSRCSSMRHPAAETTKSCRTWRTIRGRTGRSPSRRRCIIVRSAGRTLDHYQCSQLCETL
jgi:hypothetical protein